MAKGLDLTLEEVRKLAEITREEGVKATF